MDGLGFTDRTLKKLLIKYMEEHKPEQSMLAVLPFRSTVRVLHLEIKPTTSQTRECDEPQYSPTGTAEVQGRQKKAEGNDDRAP